MDVPADYNSETLTKYLNGEGIDNKLRMQTGSDVKYFLSDHLGSTNGLADSSGNLTASTNYDSFGNATNTNFPTRYQYTGREFDSFTGLHYYRARFYDANLGRFISEDPIGFRGDVNLYAYVWNNPQNFRDPSGNHPAALGAWALFELGMTGYDVYDFGSSLFDPCADWWDVGLGGGGLVLGAIAPGGGYGKIMKLSRRAARRKAMREAGIPTSQQPLPTSQQIGPRDTVQGKSYEYDASGQRKSVQQTDNPMPNEPHGPHWEAGAVKPNGQTDSLGRPRLKSSKSRVEYEK